jgi:hypothetical protein
MAFCRRSRQNVIKMHVGVFILQLVALRQDVSYQLTIDKYLKSLRNFN